MTDTELNRKIVEFLGLVRQVEVGRDWYDVLTVDGRVRVSCTLNLVPGHIPDAFNDPAMTVVLLERMLGKESNQCSVWLTRYRTGVIDCDVSGGAATRGTSDDHLGRAVATAFAKANGLTSG